MGETAPEVGSVDSQGNRGIRTGATVACCGNCFATFPGTFQFHSGEFDPLFQGGLPSRISTLGSTRHDEASLAGSPAIGLCVCQAKWSRGGTLPLLSPGSSALTGSITW